MKYYLIKVNFNDSTLQWAKKNISHYLETGFCLIPEDELIMAKLKFGERIEGNIEISPRSSMFRMFERKYDINYNTFTTKMNVDEIFGDFSVYIKQRQIGIATVAAFLTTGGFFINNMYMFYKEDEAFLDTLIYKDLIKVSREMWTLTPDETFTVTPLMLAAYNILKTSP